jgi:hypothetical protein
MATPAVAEPAPAPAETVCTLGDSRLTGLTGLVALTDGGFVVANSSPDQTNPMRVFYLDSKCKVSRPVSYGANPARDPQDLAVTSDGAVWVADIGDNSTNKADRRETIALWKMPTGGGNPVIHRLTYPDGEHHDARALLFGANDTPIIITKEPSGTAQIYESSEQLQPGTRQGVPLKNVGSWKPKRTGTPNFLAATGQILVTGAAQSPDRKRVALRTYSDAYEWNVPDGDVVKAITTGEPRITPLSNEAQGEAIAYSADGKSFLTSSNAGKILRYQPSSTSGAVAPAAGKPDTKADSRPWYQKLSLPQVINMVGALGLLGLVLVVVGVIGIQRSRKARRRADHQARANPPGNAADSNRPPVPGGPPVPPDPRRQGRAMAPPPAEPYPGGRPQPGYGGGGNVYGGGAAQPGYDQGAGRQEYSQPRYHPDSDGGDRRYPERL